MSRYYSSGYNRNAMMIGRGGFGSRGSMTRTHSYSCGSHNFRRSASPFLSYSIVRSSINPSSFSNSSSFSSFSNPSSFSSSSSASSFSNSSSAYRPWS